MMMDTPLTPEQLRKLQEISQLPPEQQREKLPAFLSTLSPEQLAFLKQQQGPSGECLFCLLSQKKMNTKTIYEDDSFIAVLDIRPATRGHTLLFPKKHVSLFVHLSDTEVAQMFTLARTISTVILNTLHANGISLYLAQGDVAGQTIPHVVLHLIPRSEQDGVSMGWQGQTLANEDLTDLQKSLSQALLPQPSQRKEEKPIHLPKSLETYRIP